MAVYVHVSTNCQDHENSAGRNCPMSSGEKELVILCFIWLPQSFKKYVENGVGERIRQGKVREVLLFFLLLISYGLKHSFPHNPGLGW